MTAPLFRNHDTPPWAYRFSILWLRGAKLLVLALSVILSLSLQLVHADETAGANVEEEIIVTARFIEESVQDLPFGVSVIDAETLERQRLNNFEDVLRSVPGVDVEGRGVRSDEGRGRI